MRNSTTSRTRRRSGLCPECGSALVIEGPRTSCSCGFIRVEMPIPTWKEVYARKGWDWAKDRWLDGVWRP